MAWIDTIDESDATGDLADLYRRVSNPDGSVDAVMKIHGANPATLRTHFEMYVEAMHKPSPLSRAERELAGVVVSRLNGCRYCLQHHLGGLKRLLPDDRHDAADAIAMGRVVQLPDRERAIVTYATKLTTNPHDVRESDVAALRAQDLDDRAILDLAQVVGYFNYVNRIVNGLGVDLEGAAHPVGAWPS